MSVLSLGAPDDVQFGAGGGSDSAVFGSPLTKQNVLRLKAITVSNGSTELQKKTAKAILNTYNSNNNDSNLSGNLQRLEADIKSKKALPAVPANAVPAFIRDNILRPGAKPLPKPPVVVNNPGSRRANLVSQGSSPEPGRPPVPPKGPDGGENPEGWMGSENLAPELGDVVKDLPTWEEFEPKRADVDQIIKDAVDASKLPKQELSAAQTQSAQLMASKLAAETIAKSLSKKVMELQQQIETQGMGVEEKVAEMAALIKQLNEWLSYYGILVHRCVYLLDYMTKEIISSQFTEDQQKLIEQATTPLIPVYAELLYQVLSTPDKTEWSVAGTRLAEFLGITEALGDSSLTADPTLLFNEVQKYITQLVNYGARADTQDMITLKAIANAKDIDKALKKK